MEKITLSLPLLYSLKKRHKKYIYHEIRVEPLVTLRVDAIFSYLSREFDDNRATLANNGNEMALSAVANKTLTQTAASNDLEKLVSK